MREEMDLNAGILFLRDGELEGGDLGLERFGEKLLLL
jgi:hypothetical protein